MATAPFFDVYRRTRSVEGKQGWIVLEFDNHEVVAHHPQTSQFIANSLCYVIVDDEREIAGLPVLKEAWQLNAKHITTG